MKWGNLGRNIVTLGIGYAIERYVAKKVPQTIAELLESLARGNAEKVPPEVQAALDALMRARFDDQLAKLAEAAARLEASFEHAGRLAEAAEKGDLVAMAKAARDRAHR